MVPTVSKHLKNIFEEGELMADSVVSKMEITTPHVAMDDEFQTHNVLFKKELPMRAKRVGFFDRMDEFTKEVGAANS